MNKLRAKRCAVLDLVTQKVKEWKNESKWTHETDTGLSLKWEVRLASRAPLQQVWTRGSWGNEENAQLPQDISTIIVRLVANSFGMEKQLTEVD